MLSSKILPHMKHRIILLCAAALISATSYAVTATSYSSFGGVEEPTKIYTVSTGAFTNDSYDNTTEPSSGNFRFTLRYRKNQWWDGDRDKTDTTRQRAEVRQLGTRQKNGETYDYSSTWKTNSGFKRGTKFTHITQIKAHNGDNAPPLVVITLVSDSSMQLQKCSGSTSGLSQVSSNSFAAGSTYTTRIRLKTSTSASGSLQFSVNGGALKGQTGIAMYRPSATEYHPKWGLYRGLDNNQPFGDDYLEHRSVSSNKQ
jgi:hypothetical protein